MREILRSMLRDLRGKDPSERDGVERMRRLIESAEDPFSRGHYEPGHFTTSAFVLSPRRDAILLVLHGKLKRWLQPGGHVEPSDRTPWDAARREVTEETGLRDLDLLDPRLRLHSGRSAAPGIFDVDVHEIPARRTEPAHLHHDLRFLFASRSLEVTAGDGVEAARWVQLSDVATIESDASVMRAVDKIRRAHLEASG